MMPRLPHLLLAAVLAATLGSANLAQSQSDPVMPPPSANTDQPMVKGKKGMTPDDRAQKKADRKAAKQKERQEKAAAKKAKAMECRTKGKQDALKGKELRAYVKSCVTS